MEYRVFALALRLMIAVIAGPPIGLSLFFLGSVAVVNYLVPGNAVAVTSNMVIGIGLGAGLAGWLFGMRLGSAHMGRRYELPLTLLIAVVSAWFGQAVLNDLLFRDVDGIRVEAADEVYGAVTGAVAGAILLPLVLGAWRVAHRQEP
jgi:hypothetical protein